MRPNGHVARRIGMRDVYRVLKEKPEENRQLVRSRSRWEDRLKRIFKQWDGESWTGLIGLRIGIGGGRL